MKLYYSKPRAVAVLLFNLAVVVWVGYLILAGLFGGIIYLLIGGLVCAIAATPLVLLHVSEPIRALGTHDAVVILDASGITDLRKKDAFLDWNDVAQVTLGGVQPTRGYLIFELRDIAKAKARVGAPAPASAKLFGRKLLLLSDWHVNLRPLKCDLQHVHKMAERLRLAALRRKVSAMNAGSTGGWSERL